MKKAIFLFDYTGIMAQPWLAAGYECWCFDSQHPEGVTSVGNLHKVGGFLEYRLAAILAIKDLVGDGVEFIFGFPPCTDLAVSGARHFKKKAQANINFQKEATNLALIASDLAHQYSISKWAVENPVSVLSTLWRKPDFSFHPWEYGGYLPVDDVHPEFPEYIAPRDAYPKKTCIWNGDGFIQPKVNPIDCTKGFSTQYKKLGGKSMKTKNIRSATPRGFAQAVFEANGGEACGKN